MKSQFEEQTGVSPKKAFGFVAIAIAAIVVIAMFFQVTATVPKGYYHIKQAAWSGQMSAKMEPGLYWQNFGDIQQWPIAYTYEFNKNEGNAIHVRFNDGSECDVEGSVRVIMPTDAKRAIDLVTVHGYTSQSDVVNKLIVPTMNNALRLTANLMSARESYTTKRPDFNIWAWDQIQNGVYRTEEYEDQVEDLISGELVTRRFKKILTDSLGTPLFQPSNMATSGITLSNFEIKSLDYDPKVRAQIAKQQEALMAVETARADAQKAEQDRLTEEAQGKARVIKAQYEEKEAAERILVQARRDSLQAVIGAGKEFHTAKLLAEAAEQTKRKEILLGQGESERKRLVMQADGALAQKLDAWLKAQQFYADAIKEYKGDWVPTTVVGGSADGKGYNGGQLMLEMMGVNAARQLGLDMGMKGK